ncbi:MAG: tyrosine-type recombinase/integrase [Nitrososphaerales archaeon]
MTSLRQIPDYGKLIDRFCEDCRLRGLTEETTRRYRSSLIIFAEFMSRRGNDLVNLNLQSLKEFLQHVKDERHAKHKTAENFFSAISAFFDYLVFEGIASTNIVLPFRKRYLRRYKDDFDDSQRRLLTLEEMSGYVSSILDPRDRAIALLFAKTGMRRSELLSLDVGDVNWKDYSITLEPHPKRSNRTVFFDDECAITLRRWLTVREKLNPKIKALFVSYQSLNRLDRNGCYEAVVKYARKLGLHDSSSSRLEDHFGPHCFRHFFTTWMLRNGMQREYVKELRGDRRREAIDIYHHIDKEELRRSYLACIPKLGV